MHRVVGFGQGGRPDPRAPLIRHGPPRVRLAAFLVSAARDSDRGEGALRRFDGDVFGLPRQAPPGNHASEPVLPACIARSLAQAGTSASLGPTTKRGGTIFQVSALLAQKDAAIHAPARGGHGAGAGPPARPLFFLHLRASFAFPQRLLFAARHRNIRLHLRGAGAAPLFAGLRKGCPLPEAALPGIVRGARRPGRGTGRGLAFALRLAPRLALRAHPLGRSRRAGHVPVARARVVHLRLNLLLVAGRGMLAGFSRPFPVCPGGIWLTLVPAPQPRRALWLFCARRVPANARAAALAGRAVRSTLVNNHRPAGTVSPSHV